MAETDNEIPPQLVEASARFHAMVGPLRPELHRYCARLVGSVVDGEDIVQETLAKAFYSLSMARELPPLRPWLFRIAHNASMDHLRRYERRRVEPTADLDAIPSLVDESPDPEVVRAALSVFLVLPVTQRSALILKDVLGHSLAETADTIGTTIAAVKAALVRGRETLRKRRTEPPASVPAADPTAIPGAGRTAGHTAITAGDTAVPADRRAIPAGPAAPAPADPDELRRLHHYMDLFNARNWDALRDLMAEECRLDLVSKASRRGKEVRQYFDRYSAIPSFRAGIGTVDGRLALLCSASPDSPAPEYFIFLEWEGDRVAAIRDFKYVPYIALDAEVRVLSAGTFPSNA